MKPRWIAVGVLAAALALALGLAMGLWRGEPAPPGDAPPPVYKPPPAPAEKEVAPLRTAAWMLAHSAPAAAPAPAVPPPNDDSACGPSRAPCPDDWSCIQGACVTTLCPADGGPGIRCELPAGTVGTCCGPRCADLAADGANCGACGATCLQGLDCVSGRCQARSCAGRMAGTLCSRTGGETGGCCRDRCVDPSTWASDAANCGGCGHTCAPGLTCKQASCLDPVSGGPPSWTCVDRGHECPADTFCVMDACYPSKCSGDTDGLLCPDPAGGKLLGHCCGPVCADLFADRNNCRACGVRCGPGEACKNGDCVASEP